MRFLLTILLLQAVLLVGSTLSANADELNLCKDGTGPVLHRNEPHTDDCERRDSVMNHADVIWQGLIAKTTKAPSPLVIEGSTADGHFTPVRAHGENASPPAPICDKRVAFARGNGLRTRKAGVDQKG
jgi:hypothetical protein